MSNSVSIPPFLQVKPLNTNEAPEDPNSCLSLNQNRILPDHEDSQTEVSQKVIRMPKEHFLACFQPKNDFGEVLAENNRLKERNEELKQRYQALIEYYNSINHKGEENPEAAFLQQNEQDAVKIEVEPFDIE